jgi:hypothetical protein
LARWILHGQTRRFLQAWGLKPARTLEGSREYWRIHNWLTDYLCEK